MRYIAFFYRVYTSLISFFVFLPPAPSPFLSHSFSPRQIILPGIFFPASTACGPEGAPLSHLESNRGPLSKKLISLNIILGASGSRRALTDPSVHPRPRPLYPLPQNPPVSAPCFVSAPRARSPSLPPKPASLLFTLARLLLPPSPPLIF